MQELKAKLYLNMILAEQEPVEIVKRAIDSIKDQVDGLYIAVTYSETEPTDESELVKFLKSYGANIFYFKWVHDFAAARQFIMDQTPHGENAYIFWIDADDVVQNPSRVRELFDLAVVQQWGAVFLRYYYMVDLNEKGEVREILVEHKRERIVRNDNSFKWVGMLHETLIEQQTENVIKVWQPSFDDCIIVHLTTADRIDKNLERNIAILENQARTENHRDPRTLIYLAKAYFDKGKIKAEDPNESKICFDLAVALFEEYLQGQGDPGQPGYIDGSGWPEERSTAWNYIAEISRMRGQFNVAIRALHNALIEAPEFPNYYIDMAMLYSMKGDHKKSKHWLQLATAIPMPETTIITTPRDLKTRALEVDYNIALSEGKLDRAVEDSKLLIDILPDVQALKDRLVLVESMAAANKAAQSVVYLGKYLEQIKEPEKLLPLIQSIPQDLQQEKFASEMRHKFMPPRIWGEDEIVILCGPGFEPWSPKSIETGLGGSEEAVVYLSQELTQLGWKVTVYAHPQQAAGNYEGVEYKQWYDLNQKDRFNVLVLWRNIGAADLNLQANYTLVWLHDVPSNPDFTEERVNKINKVAVLSEYHLSLLRFFKNGEFYNPPASKILLTSNGIPDMETSVVKRNPHSMIYASSPDRGLIYLLNNWPLIRKEVPDATLDVYYGFVIFDAIHANNPARMNWKFHLMEMMKQEGITYKGRIGHKELNKALCEAAVWPYPTDFQEISCILGMKAQACGTVPVVTNFAALQETVRNGIKVDVDITTAEGQKEYVKSLIDVLKDEALQEELRPAMMKWAQQKFPWSLVAKQWEEEFKRVLAPKPLESQQAIIEQVESEVIPPTQEVNTKILKVVIPEGGVE